MYKYTQNRILIYAVFFIEVLDNGGDMVKCLEKRRSSLWKIKIKKLWKKDMDKFM